MHHIHVEQAEGAAWGLAAALAMHQSAGLGLTRPLCVGILRRILLIAVFVRAVHHGDARGGTGLQ